MKLATNICYVSRHCCIGFQGHTFVGQKSKVRVVTRPCNL